MNESITLISSLFIFLFPYIGRLWFNRTVLANTVVTLGVLGTFSGIFIGLQEFDIRNIEDALPLLLEGLKTAFLTSIAGMCSSLLLKLCPAFYLVKAEETQNQEDETRQLLNTLSRIEENTAANTEALVTHLSALDQSFNHFAQHISGLHAEALVTALQQVMEKWDSQASEQLSPTLQEIREAVRQLEKTEAENAESLKNISENISKALESLRSTTDTLSVSLNKTMNLSHKQSESVSGQINQLGTLMQTTEAHWEKQMNEMEERFQRELSTMEQFTKTLLSIIKKLSQDHNALLKRQQEEN